MTISCTRGALLARSRGKPKYRPRYRSSLKASARGFLTRGAWKDARRVFRRRAGEQALSAGQAAVLGHLRRCFAGHRVDVREPPDGHVEERIPGFRVAAVAPGPVIGRRVYVSLGAW